MWDTNVCKFIIPGDIDIQSIRAQYKFMLPHAENLKYLEPILVINNKLITTDGHDDIPVWDLSTGKFEYIFKGHGGSIADIQELPGNRMVSVASDAKIRVYNLTSKEYEYTLYHNYENVFLSYRMEGLLQDHMIKQ